MSHGSKLLSSTLLSSTLLSSTLSTDDLAQALGGPVDLVVWNVGRSTDLLTYLGDLVLSVSHTATVVFAAGMDKHLPPTTGDELRKHGAVTTHPGRKKAHLFELHPSGANPTTVSQPPGPLLRSVRIDEHQLDVGAWPGVFSSEQFDLGTRLLADLAADLDNILPEAEQVVDLGCGTGVLGMLALRSLPRATVSFIDESAHAIESARHNVLTNWGSLGPTPEARSHFIRSHIFDDARLPEIDVILCNPPFHHTNAMNDAIAWQMFVQSSKVLRPGGELWVVANRHLGYHEKLTRIFDATAQMVSHPKFVVIAARR